MNRRVNLDRRASSTTPLVITNQCSEEIYPAILTQSGNGPGTGGFGLNAGNTRTLTVSESWQGRVWGRTNCSFNSAGDGPGGSITNGQACSTGDCGGIVDCRGAGVVPTSLAEFTLDTGSGQTFYDISLVDGYNLPMAIVLVPKGNSSFQAVPPNVTNPSCVGSVGNLASTPFNPYNSGTGVFLGTNASDPLPFDTKVSLSQASMWCPANLEVNYMSGPSSGVYTYPDGNVERPAFDPCFSACAKFNKPNDCCTGQYGSPSSCQPSTYSKAVKAICPDAYSYAFDDQTSTFIVPAGAGFQVVFCPGGRSTNILATEAAALTQLAQQGQVTSVSKRDENDLNRETERDNADQTGLTNGHPGGDEKLVSMAPVSMVTAAPPSSLASTQTYGDPNVPTSVTWGDVGRWGNAGALLHSSPSYQVLASQTQSKPAATATSHKNGGTSGGESCFAILAGCLLWALASGMMFLA